MYIDHSTITALLQQTADTIIMPRWKNLRSQDIRHKAADDVVTIADREAELFLSSQLQKLLPGSVVVGEEASHGSADYFQRLRGDAPVWVIDPLDGTGNFAAGHDKFALMVCLIDQHETLAAWIYDPVRRILTCAERGGGAFANGERLHIAQMQHAVALSSLRGALLTRLLPNDLRATARAAASQFAETLMSRCGGFDYHAFVSGRLDFLFYWRTLVWDHAPGSLIAQEAGGVVRRLDGSPYRPTDQRSGLLVAGDENIWQQLQKVLTPSITLV